MLKWFNIQNCLSLIVWWRHNEYRSADSNPAAIWGTEKKCTLIMLSDGCSSNFITLPYAFVFFDWFSLHWWKWICVQSQQRRFYLWQMEFESVCCFNNLLLRNCLSVTDHYKAASTRSHKQINYVFRWKFEGKYPQLGSTITYSAAGAFGKIVYPSFICL